MKNILKMGEETDWLGLIALPTALQIKTLCISVSRKELFETEFYYSPTSFQNPIFLLFHINHYMVCFSEKDENQLFQSNHINLNSHRFTFSKY